MQSNAAKGYTAVIAAAVMWASTGTVGKALFVQGMSPPELVQIRVTLASILLAIGFASNARSLLRIQFRHVGYFMVLGGVVMALVQVTYFYAISQIQVAAAILIQYTAPAMVALYSICFWGERLTAGKLVALIMSLVGCYLVVGGYSLELMHMNRAGLAAGLASAICFAAYTLLGERGMHRYSPWTVVFYSLFFAAVFWNITQPPFQFVTAGYNLVQWGYLFYIVLVGTVAAFGLFLIGVSHIRSTRAIITSTVEPISAGFIAFLFLGESLRPLQICGGALVIGAIVLLQIQREEQELTPELIRAQGQKGRRQVHPTIDGD
jgi:drug/metabolite transporter (DMT)-like permease